VSTRAGAPVGLVLLGAVVGLGSVAGLFSVPVNRAGPVHAAPLHARMELATQTDEPRAEPRLPGYGVFGDSFARAKKLAETKTPAQLAVAAQRGDPDAARAVALVSDKRAAAKTLQPLASAPDEKVRRGAVDGLASMGKEGLKPLVEALAQLQGGSAEARAREDVMAAIQSIGPEGEAAVRLVMEALQPQGATASGPLPSIDVAKILQSIEQTSARVRALNAEQ
jgi:hypothetical protein